MNTIAVTSRGNRYRRIAAAIEEIHQAELKYRREVEAMRVLRNDFDGAIPDDIDEKMDLNTIGTWKDIKHLFVT